MLWNLSLAFLGGLFGSLLGTELCARYLVKRHLHPEKNEGTLKSSAPRIFKRQPEKRVPRANTDLIAYQKELQEQGENRG